jgi:hypothetical protein
MFPTAAGGTRTVTARFSIVNSAGSRVTLSLSA